MYKSKLIQFMQIDDGTGKKYQIDNEEYETLVKKITEQIFGGKQINLNKDILLGLMYDSGLRSSKRIEMLDYHFVRQHSLGDTVSFSDMSYDECMRTTFEFKELMRKCKDLVQLEDTFTYKDLVIAYLGYDSLKHGIFLAEDIKTMKVDDLIEMIRHCLKIEGKDLTVDTIRRVVALAGRKYNVQNLLLVGEVVGSNKIYLGKLIRLFSIEEISAPISAISNTLQLIERCLGRSVTFDRVESSKIVDFMTDAIARSEEIVEIN